MKKKELFKDDFLTDLLNNTTLESPSDDFVGNIMRRVEAMPGCQPHKKSFYQVAKPILPWVLLVTVFVVSYFFSGLPLAKFIPAGEYLYGVLSPSVNVFFSSFKDLASNKFYSIALVVLLSGGGLFIIERLISHRISANRHYLI